MGTTPSRRGRSSDRVSLAVGIRIFGSDAEGRTFSDEARTLQVSRHGALIVTNRSLAPHDEIFIRLGLTRKETPAQIIGQVRKQPDGLVYGVKFLDPNVNLWDITFPPMSEAERAVGRTLLECAKCQLREVVYLDEFETEVYQAHRYIYRHCKRCRDLTIWNEAAHEWKEKERVTQRPSPALPSEPKPAPRTREERLHKRINCKLRACIRYKQHYDDEVLDVNNVSRGGICFTTRKYLAPGTKIEIATPYSPGMANIFVPAEIVRLKPLAGQNLYEYGAKYSQHPYTWR